MEEPLDRWFKREILAHEEALLRYLLRTWPNREEVLDLRQDAYVRVYEAAAKLRPQAPKSFLFATARHLMTDRIRRQRIVSIDPDVFSVGQFALTGLHHTPVLIHRSGENRYELFAMRTFALSVWEWLTDAALSFGYEIVGSDRV